LDAESIGLVPSSLACSLSPEHSDESLNTRFFLEAHLMIWPNDGEENALEASQPRHLTKKKLETQLAQQGIEA